MIQLYWQLGQLIIEKQAQTAWGSKFLEQLSKDLQVEFPGTTGFSVRNLKFMHQLAPLYPEIGKQPVAQLPWGHIIVLMQKVKDSQASAKILTIFVFYLLQRKQKNSLLKIECSPSMRIVYRIWYWFCLYGSSVQNYGR